MQGPPPTTMDIVVLIVQIVCFIGQVWVFIQIRRDGKDLLQTKAEMDAARRERREREAAADSTYETSNGPGPA